MKTIAASVLLSLMLFPAMSRAAGPQEVRSTGADQEAVAVTIYDSDLALVKDQRKIALPAGQSRLALRDVSAQIRPETAVLRSISSPGSLSVVEQNFDFDLLTPQKLLEKYVGKTVTVIRTNAHTGEETAEQATVLAASNGVVLKVGKRIETGVPGRIVYDDVPANLRDRPTLVTRIDSRAGGEQAVELSYLTGGLSWKADYVAELDANDEAMDLAGWVTLTNTSGASYREARLQLVAGDVHRVEPPKKREMAMYDAAPAPVAGRQAMAEQPLMEYHLYTLGRPTTIAENQTKQVALLTAQRVPVRKELALDGEQYYYMESYGELGQQMKVDVYLEFENREDARLGVPLPKGTIRVYKRDGDGNAQFVGEDAIDHTPRNEKVRLKLGQSFDVTADKKQTDFKLHKPPHRGVSEVEAAFEIVLKNGKKQPATVVVREPIPGDWKVLSESARSTKPSAHTAQWTLTVPPGGKSILRYRVSLRF